MPLCDVDSLFQMTNEGGNQDFAAVEPVFGPANALLKYVRRDPLLFSDWIIFPELVKLVERAFDTFLQRPGQVAKADSLEEDVHRNTKSMIGFERSMKCRVTIASRPPRFKSKSDQHN